MMDQTSDGITTGRSRYTRRLSDKIVIAFHQACDEGDYEVAAQLLEVLETIARRQADGIDRRARDSLIAAHERLWALRHPDPYD